MTRALHIAHLAQLGWLVSAAVLGAGCGDSSHLCGPGTTLEEGVCVGAGGTVTCTNGTRLDPETHACEIDPASCQDGTVLINGACKNPSSEITPEVLEGAEPNGGGVGGELSTTPAGEITLKDIGAGSVVVKGNIRPGVDRDDDGQPDGDFDTYLLDVSAPTLLDVSVDGLGGLAGAFVALGHAAGLEDWIRFGVNTTGDTTRRQLFLPAAGTYVLTVADTRTLLAGSAVGDPDNAYYMSIEQLAIPTASSLPVTAGVATATGTITDTETRFFSAPMGLGLNEVSLVTDHPDYEGSLISIVGNQFQSISDERKANPGGDVPASLTVGGVDTGETSLLVIDQIINTTPAPVPFVLEVRTHAAVALSATGGTTTADNVLDSHPFPASYDDVAQFYFDATAAGQVLGMDLRFNTGVDGLVLDETGSIVSLLSWDLFGFGFGDGTIFSGYGTATFTGYTGLFRAPAPGRYYVVLNAPLDAAGADVVATSTLTPLTPAAQTTGTPISMVAPNAFNSVPYLFTTAEEWAQFSIAATAASGGATVEYYDAGSAFGALDTVLVDDGTGPAPAPIPDADPLFSVSAAAGGSASTGRILIGAAQPLVAKVRTQNAAGTFDLDAVRQTFTAEGTIAAGATTMHTNQVLDATTTRQLYLIKASPRNTLTTTVVPSALLDPQVRVLTTAETATITRNTAGIGGMESFNITVPASGWVAIEVSSPGPIANAGTFTVSFSVYRPQYLTGPGTTAWSNACIGGTDVTPDDRDDALTAPITTPAFRFFTEPNLTSIKVSTNGWLTFDAATTGSFPVELTLPNSAAPSGIVAPYWDDLTRVRICTKQSGTRFIVQWRGELKRVDASYPQADVGVQAVLDSSDHSIEFVYAPYMEATGSTGGGPSATRGASAGIESLMSVAGVTLFFHTDGVIPGTSVKLTP
ncbi:MAG: hypothetical protein JWP01_3758 [Myxococcales bacterium]|nr:hypothetical protein [Myxococcales bacterium]